MPQLRSEDRGQNLFLGKFRGLVHSRKDPEKRGRIKVIVPSVFGKDPLPRWAEPCFSQGGHLDWGEDAIPPTGSGVWVEFEGGDPDFPIWVGCPRSMPKDDNGDAKSESPRFDDYPYDDPDADSEEVGFYDDEDPSRWVMRGRSGSVVAFDEKTDEEGLQGDPDDSEERAVKVYILASKDAKVITLRDLLVGVRRDMLAVIKNLCRTTVKEGNWEALIEKGDVLFDVDEGKFLAQIEDDMEFDLESDWLVDAEGKIDFDSADIRLGEEAAHSIQKLIDLRFMALFNSHTHNYTLPQHGAGQAPTSAPNQPLVEDQHTSTETRAS